MRPRSFADTRILLMLALDALPHLRRLMAIADRYPHGWPSLTVLAEYTRTLPDGFELATIRKLPEARKLARLIEEAFGQPVAIFCPPVYRNGPIINFTEEGWGLVYRAREFIASLPGQARGA